MSSSVSVSKAARLSMCEFSTPQSTFAEDLAHYASAGITGIGICEFKIVEDAEALAKFHASGLTATHCVPEVPSILPLPLMEGPDDPRERVRRICSSLARLAEFEPQCCVFLTGPAGERDAKEARKIVLDAIRTIADVAATNNVRLALEPVHASQHDLFAFVTTIPAALDLLDDAGADSVGIMLDTWHLWETENFLEHITTHSERILGVHVADWRDPTRNQFDRVLPGDGIAPLVDTIRTLENSGYGGWYDIEIFSDTALADSLWDLDPEELARLARQSFERVWADAVSKQ